MKRESKQQQLFHLEERAASYMHQPNQTPPQGTLPRRGRLQISPHPCMPQPDLHLQPQITTIRRYMHTSVFLSQQPQKEPPTAPHLFRGPYSPGRWHTHHVNEGNGKTTSGSPTCRASRHGRRTTVPAITLSPFPPCACRTFWTDWKRAVSSVGSIAKEEQGDDEAQPYFQFATIYPHPLTINSGTLQGTTPNPSLLD